MGIRGMTVSLCLDLSVWLHLEISVYFILINPAPDVCSNISSYCFSFEVQSMT